MSSSLSDATGVDRSDSPATTNDTECFAFYELTVNNRKGKPFPFARLRGDVVLVVNTATACGFSKGHFGPLEDLYSKYRHLGFEILAFPCNQFLYQEPRTEEEIVEHCSSTYGTTFTFLEKIKVNGKDASEVYKYLKSEKAGIFGIKRVKWNFEKFLIDRNGKVVDRFSSFTKPKKLEEKIEQLLFDTYPGNTYYQSYYEQYLEDVKASKQKKNESSKT